MTLRPEAMRRCLANLIGNAQRHARTIAVAATALDDGVEITIDDDGPGIPADKREDVFRRSCASIPRATPRPAASASASPSPATSPQPRRRPRAAGVAARRPAGAPVAAGLEGGEV
jgi:hypothetical protein